MIYLDNAATTAMDSEVIATLQFYMHDQFANSGAVYGLGLDAKNKIEEAIESISACLLYTSPSPRDRQKSRMPSSA